MSFSKNTGWEGSNKVPQWSQSLSTIQSVCATIVEIYKSMNFEENKKTQQFIHIIKDKKYYYLV